MGELAQRFPPKISVGAEGGHGYWDVGIVEHAAGYETPNLNWELARGRWNVSKIIEVTGTHRVARSHFYKARGRFHRFRFKDHTDFQAARTGDDKGRLTGSTTAWQINKVYGADEASFEYVRPLIRIVAGTLQIWRNGALQTLTTNYTVNNDTGIVTSLASWAGSTLEVACEFDCLCRYDTAAFSAQLAFKRGGGYMMNWANIDIVEVRE